MSIERTLDEHEKTHGSFPMNALVSQGLKAVIRCGSLAEGIGEPLCDVHQEALDVICTKIGRIVAGDANSRDHWHDIAGYAALGERGCTNSIS